MNTIIKTLAAMLVFGTPLYAAGNYGDAYNELAKAAANAALERGYNKVSMEAFVPQGTAKAAEAQAVQRAFSEALFDTKMVAVMDAAALLRIGQRGQVWAEVSVSGYVHRGPGGLKLVLKAADRRRGGAIVSLEAKLPEGGGDADLRDAPNSPADPVCGALRRELREWNEANIDLKARYWATKMREPGFSYRGREGQPGDELAGYEVKQRFYYLVNEYYGLDGPVPLEPAEEEVAEKFIRGEKEALVKCPRG